MIRRFLLGLSFLTKVIELELRFQWWEKSRKKWLADTKRNNPGIWLTAFKGEEEEEAYKGVGKLLED